MNALTVYASHVHNAFQATNKHGEIIEKGQMCQTSGDETSSSTGMNPSRGPPYNHFMHMQTFESLLGFKE